MPSNFICCHCFWRFIIQLVQFKCDTLACRSRRPAKPNLAKEKQAALLPPFLFRNPRKEWTHGKSTLALWRNASYLFLSLLTSLIATSCSEDAMVNQNLPFCLATLKQSKSATRRAKISTYQRPDPAQPWPPLRKQSRGLRSSQWTLQSVSEQCETRGIHSQQHSWAATKQTICQVHVDKLHA